MNEWTVVMVIIALVGLIAAVVTPVGRLNATITRLTVTVEGLEKNFDAMTNKNSEGHGKLWDRLSEHDEALTGHGERLTAVEQSTKQAHHRLDRRDKGGA
jgi:hypothetical protein